MLALCDAACKPPNETAVNMVVTIDRSKAKLPVLLLRTSAMMLA